MIEENNINQTSVNQLNLDNKSKKIGIVPYLISLLIVAILSGGGVYLWQVNKTKISFDNNVVLKATPTEVEIENISPTVSESLPIDWKVYRNEKYGFEFKYPSSLFNPQEIIHKGENGFIFLLGSPSEVTKSEVDESSFFVAGKSLDFIEGRSGWIIDFQGYKNDNGNIKLRSMSGELGTRNENFTDLPKEVISNIFINNNGVEVVMVTGEDNKDEMGGPVFGTAGKGRINSLINTKSGEIPGLTFIAPIGFSKDDLFKIMSSVKVW